MAVNTAYARWYAGLDDGAEPSLGNE